MKKEVPPVAIVIVAVLGVAALVGIWMMSGNSGGLTQQQKDLAIEQSKTRAERDSAYANGVDATTAPPTGSEQEARSKTGTSTGN